MIVALVLAGVASAKPNHYASTRLLQDARVGHSKPELVAQIAYSTRVVHRLGHSWRVAPRHRTCWSHVAWSRVCDQARHRLAAHRWLLSIAEARLDAIRSRELLATTSTYLGAVRYVERYFGSQPFLHACPLSEGGYGAWVPNHYGSGAGGWLQFMSGTFYGIIDEAISSARARGMRVPASARSWYSPLGQALAAVQMLADGRRGEWTGGTC
jgi:hypothetical protein